ncbi:unnamed protein product, partial [Sphagnum tenellum]
SESDELVEEDSDDKKIKKKEAKKKVAVKSAASSGSKPVGGGGAGKGKKAKLSDLSPETARRELRSFISGAAAVLAATAAAAAAAAAAATTRKRQKIKRSEKVVRETNGARLEASETPPSSKPKPKQNIFDRVGIANSEGGILRSRANERMVQIIRRMQTLNMSARKVSKEIQNSTSVIDGEQMTVKKQMLFAVATQLQQKIRPTAKSVFGVQAEAIAEAERAKKLVDEMKAIQASLAAQNKRDKLEKEWQVERQRVQEKWRATKHTPTLDKSKYINTNVFHTRKAEKVKSLILSATPDSYTERRQARADREEAARLASEKRSDEFWLPFTELSKTIPEVIKLQEGDDASKQRNQGPRVPMPTGKATNKLATSTKVVISELEAIQTSLDAEESRQHVKALQKAKQVALREERLKLIETSSSSSDSTEYESLSAEEIDTEFAARPAGESRTGGSVVTSQPACTVMTGQPACTAVTGKPACTVVTSQPAGTEVTRQTGGAVTKRQPAAASTESGEQKSSRWPILDQHIRKYSELKSQSLPRKRISEIADKQERIQAREALMRQQSADEKSRIYGAYLQEREQLQCSIVRMQTLIEKIRGQNGLTPVDQAARYETVNQVLTDASALNLLQTNMRQAMQGRERERRRKAFLKEEQLLRDQWAAENDESMQEEEWVNASHLSTKQRLSRRGILLSNKNSRVSGKTSPHIRQQQQSDGSEPWLTKAGKKRVKQARDRERAEKAKAVRFADELSDSEREKIRSYIDYVQTLYYERSRVIEQEIEDLLSEIELIELEEEQQPGNVVADLSVTLSLSDGAQEGAAQVVRELLETQSHESMTEEEKLAAAIKRRELLTKYGNYASTSLQSRASKQGERKPKFLESAVTIAHGLNKKSHDEQREFLIEQTAYIPERHLSRISAEATGEGREARQMIRIIPEMLYKVLLWQQKQMNQTVKPENRPKRNKVIPPTEVDGIIKKGERKTYLATKRKLERESKAEKVAAKAAEKFNKEMARRNKIREEKLEAQKQQEEEEETARRERQVAAREALEEREREQARERAAQLKQEKEEQAAAAAAAVAAAEAAAAAAAKEAARVAAQREAEA